LTKHVIYLTWAGIWCRLQVSRARSNRKTAAYETTHRHRPKYLVLVYRTFKSAFFLFSIESANSKFVQENTCVNRDKEKFLFFWLMICMNRFLTRGEREFLCSIVTRDFNKNLTDENELCLGYHLSMLDHNEQIEHEFHVHRYRHRPYDRVHLLHRVSWWN